MDERRNCQTIKDTHKIACRAEDFKNIALSEFHLRTMFPNETPWKNFFQYIKTLQTSHNFQILEYHQTNQNIIHM